jgi:hypothetical protein
VRQLKLINIIAGLFEAQHASNPIQEMRGFLRELRISISGFNKAQQFFPYKLFQRVCPCRNAALSVSRPRIARPISDGTLFLTQPFVPLLKHGRSQPKYK